MHYGGFLSVLNILNHNIAEGDSSSVICQGYLVPFAVLKRIDGFFSPFLCATVLILCNTSFTSSDQQE